MPQTMFRRKGASGLSKSKADGTYAPLAGLFFPAVDATGATDATATIKAIQTAQGSNPYCIMLPAGTLKLGTSTDLLTFGRNQGMLGQGSGQTLINYVGNGTAVKVYDSSFNTSLSVAGAFGGFTINGSGAGNAAVGFSWGNMLQAKNSDITVKNFAGTTGYGFYLKNGSTGAWSENGNWLRCSAIGNTSNLMFDTSSFDYSTYEFYLYAGSGQTGVTLQNGAILQGCEVRLRGNCTAGVGNTAYAVGIDPAGGGTGTSTLSNSGIDIQLEMSGSGTAHTSIVLGGAATPALQGTGILSFINGGIPFIGMAAPATTALAFTGWIDEPTLGSPVAGDSQVTIGGTQKNLFGGLSTQNAYDGMQFYPQFADVQAFYLPNGAIAVSAFNGQATFKRVVALTLFMQQPTSGAAGTMTWPSNVKWAGSSALSVTNSAVDKILLVYLPSEENWYAQVVKADPPYTLNAQTGTTYTAILGDAGALVTLNNASAITVTHPANASVAYPIGTRIQWAQIGAGQVSFATGGGVTVESRGSALKIAGQYGVAESVKIGTNTWLLIGDLST